MRRTTTSVLALAVAGCAALAAFVSPAGATTDGSVITFARASATQPSSDASAAGRVFYLVYANSRTLFGTVGDEDTGVGSGAGASVPDDSGATGGDEEGDPFSEAQVSIPETEDGQFRVLLLSGLAGNALSYSQAMNDLELPFMFAGREQWVRNLGGEGVEGEPRLWDVTMESITHDDSAKRVILGRAAVTAERGLSGANDLSYWQSLVPSWAPRVRDELARQGIPFSVELLADPDINLTDPSKPLFAKGSSPLSLFQLGSLQAGERAFLRSLSAEDLMLDVWPAYYRYYHRPAGAPVPADLLAGMTFGSPVLRADGTYLVSPVMSSTAYRRWARYGYPGDAKVTDATAAADQFSARLDQSYLFTGAYGLFAPATISADTLTRYETLATGG